MKREPLILVLLPLAFIALALAADLFEPLHLPSLSVVSFILWLYTSALCVVRGVRILKNDRRTGLTCISAGAAYLGLLLAMCTAPLA